MKVLSWFPRFLCTALSMIAGVLGYSWAVKSSPSAAEIFVQAGLLSLILQTFLYSIASNRKSRLVTGLRCCQLDLRSSISVSISTLSTIGFAVLTLIFWGSTRMQVLFMFVTLFLLDCTLQPY